MPEMFTDRATGSNCTKRLDIKMNPEQITIKKHKAWKACVFHIIWFCHERHGMYILCVDWCSLSCHTVIKHFVYIWLKLIFIKQHFYISATQISAFSWTHKEILLFDLPTNRWSCYQYLRNMWNGMYLYISFLRATSTN